MDAALGYLEKIGLERIEKHTIGLAAELREGIQKLGCDVLYAAEQRITDRELSPWARSGEA